MGLWAGHVTRVNFHTYQFILDTVFLPLPRSQCSNIYTQSNMVVHSFLMANQFNSVNCSKHRCLTKTIDRSYVATYQQKRAGGRKPLLSMYTFIPGWLSCSVLVSISPIERRSTCWTQSVSLAPNTWIFNPNYRQPLTGKSFSITCTPRHPSLSSCHGIWLCGDMPECIAKQYREDQQRWRDAMVIIKTWSSALCPRDGRLGMRDIVDEKTFRRRR